MRKASMKTRTVKISAKTRKLYERRDQSLDHGDVPQLSPDEWAKATVGKFYRPIKTSISLRIDNDVLAWLKSKGDGYQSRINSMLREGMDADRGK